MREKTTVFHPYVDSPRFKQRRAETEEMFSRVEPALINEGFVFKHVAVDGDRAYPREFKALWLDKNAGDALVVEQDMVAGIERFRELRDCQEQICVLPYNVGDIVKTTPLTGTFASRTMSTTPTPIPLEST